VCGMGRSLLVAGCHGVLVVIPVISEQPSYYIVLKNVCSLNGYMFTSNTVEIFRLVVSPFQSVGRILCFNF
jgi:hypothetical protein